ncbi:hypothetical protein AADR41_26935 [Streptomyces sp. CLV115]|uniref:hypothetical protein n=1 Tax=Streptomyces sp. CLV115 TaxID=3138502 RepID=UPI00313EECFD
MSLAEPVGERAHHDEVVVRVGEEKRVPVIASAFRSDLFGLGVSLLCHVRRFPAKVRRFPAPLMRTLDVGRSSLRMLGSPVSVPLLR